jgi:hypothetical protein
MAHGGRQTFAFSKGSIVDLATTAREYQSFHGRLLKRAKAHYL